MKDAAVYRFAIEWSFDLISKHNDKNDQKDVDIILGALSPDWDGVDVRHYNIAALSLKLLNIFLDVIVTGSSPDWDCADVRCCATFCHCPQWTWPVAGKYHSLLKILLSMSMILKIFEIYLIKFCIYDWFVLLHLALSVFVTTTFFFLLDLCLYL